MRKLKEGTEVEKSLLCVLEMQVRIGSCVHDFFSRHLPYTLFADDAMINRKWGRICKGIHLQ